MPPVPRNEYPRPSSGATNGSASTARGSSRSTGATAGWSAACVERPLSEQIVVPFCPESALSGIGNADFLNAVWYRREVTIPARWAGRRVLLHFQAVDYDATVWVNGAEVGRHRGGFTPFTCDLAASPDRREVDDRRAGARQPARPAGRAASSPTWYANYGCHYTRTTGHLADASGWSRCPPCTCAGPGSRPDVAAGVRCRSPLHRRPADPGTRCARRCATTPGAVAVADGGRRTSTSRRSSTCRCPSDRRRLWSRRTRFCTTPGSNCSTRTGAVIDARSSYAGLRRWRSTAGDPHQRRARSSSGWCSTRATIPTAS